MKPPQQRLGVLTCLLAFWVGLCIALSGCGGGDDELPCLVETVTLSDGRVVSAPNNCPPAARP